MFYPTIYDMIVFIFIFHIVSLVMLMKMEKDTSNAWTLPVHVATLCVCVTLLWLKDSAIMVMTGAKIFIEIGVLSISIKNGKRTLPYTHYFCHYFSSSFFVELDFPWVRLGGIGSSVRKQYLIHTSRSGNNKYWVRHGVYLRGYNLRY